MLQILRLIKAHFSTNSDLARLDGLRLGKMDGQQTLLYMSAYSSRVDAGIQIEYTAILTHFPLTVDSSSKVACRGGAMTTKDELAVLDGYLHALLAYAWHFDFQSESVRILMKIHSRSEVLNALSRFRFNWC